MSKMVQVRNVPDELHRRLKARAALEGLSISDYLLQQIRRVLEKPTREELLDRIRSRSRPANPIDAAGMIREERDRR